MIISDTKKNIKIKTNKLKYLKKDQKILTEDLTNININDKFLIKSEFSIYFHFDHISTIVNFEECLFI